VNHFDQVPLLVIWEVTRSCDLACIHCRASAEAQRHPLELTTAEGFKLLETIRGFGDPLMVFSGGDPLKRPDLLELLGRSVQLGIRTTVSPSPTPLLTPDAIRSFKHIGVSRMSISVDGHDAASHDSFRGVEGSFGWATQALREARRVGLGTQINTTVNRRNMHQLHEIAGLAESFGCEMWDVFFLVPTGRAQSEDELSSEEYERVFEFLYELSKRAPFVVKTTEAMHYRRFVARKRKAEGRPDAPVGGPMGRMRGINSGRGFVFISRTGDIFPSGFLPIKAGNVRQDSLLDIYQQAPLFRELRDSSLLLGKCGYCPYRNLCGGSRSRAYAVTGNYLSAEPRCSFDPLSADVEAAPVAEPFPARIRASSCSLA
jgi:radical SAM protein